MAPRTGVLRPRCVAVGPTHAGRVWAWGCVVGQSGRRASAPRHCQVRSCSRSANADFGAKYSKTEDHPPALDRHQLHGPHSRSSRNNIQRLPPRRATTPTPSRRSRLVGNVRPGQPPNTDSCAAPHRMAGPAPTHNNASSQLGARGLCRAVWYRAQGERYDLPLWAARLGARLRPRSLARARVLSPSVFSPSLFALSLSLAAREAERHHRPGKRLGARRPHPSGGRRAALPHPVDGAAPRQAASSLRRPGPPHPLCGSAEENAQRGVQGTAHPLLTTRRERRTEPAPTRAQSRRRPRPAKSRQSRRRRRCCRRRRC